MKRRTKNCSFFFFLIERHHTDERGMNWHNFLELHGEFAIDIKSFLKSLNFLSKVPVVEAMYLKQLIMDTHKKFYLNAVHWMEQQEWFKHFQKETKP